MTALFTREGQPLAATGRNAKGQPIHQHPAICGRCGGAGRSDKWAATGYTCFDCGGSGRGGITTLRLYDAEALARLNVGRDKLRAAKAAKLAAAQAERLAAEAVARHERAVLVAADPLVIELRALAGRSEFLADLAAKAEVRDLSERQREAAQVAISRLRQRDTEQASSEWLGAEGERVEIVGEVRMAKFIRPGQFYGQGDTYLLKVWTERGFACWFTTKAYEKGDRLVGKATVKALGCYQGVKETTITRFLAAR